MPMGRDIEGQIEAEINVEVDEDAPNYRDEDGPVLYPNITVQMVGEDGNTGAIMGRISRALRRARVPENVVTEFRNEMLSGDYNNVLATAQRWVDCE